MILLTRLKTELVTLEGENFKELQAELEKLYGIALKCENGGYILFPPGRSVLTLPDNATVWDLFQCVRREVERLFIQEADRARKGEIDAGEAVALFRLPIGWTAFGKCLEIMEKEYGPGLRVSGRQDHYIKLVK